MPLARLLLPHLCVAALLPGVQAEGHKPAEQVAGQHCEHWQYCEQEHGHSSVAGISVYADLQNLIFRGCPYITSAAITRQGHSECLRMLT